LWIRRLNTFLRHQVSQANGATQRTVYSSCINSLKKANILLNRKVLSQLAIFDPESLRLIVNEL
jgi:large subunit ribosomal protein L20